jgi:hypothetical protein
LGVWGELMKDVSLSAKSGFCDDREDLTFRVFPGIMMSTITSPIELWV